MEAPIKIPTKEELLNDAQRYYEYYISQASFWKNIIDGGVPAVQPKAQFYTQASFSRKTETKASNPNQTLAEWLVEVLTAEGRPMLSVALYNAAKNAGRRVIELNDFTSQLSLTNKNKGTITKDSNLNVWGLTEWFESGRLKQEYKDKII